jgi:hypothetical protein
VFGACGYHRDDWDCLARLPRLLGRLEDGPATAAFAHDSTAAAFVVVGSMRTSTPFTVAATAHPSRLATSQASSMAICGFVAVIGSSFIVTCIIASLGWSACSGV